MDPNRKTDFLKLYKEMINAFLMAYLIFYYKNDLRQLMLQKFVSLQTNNAWRLYILGNSRLLAS